MASGAQRAEDRYQNWLHDAYLAEARSSLGQSDVEFPEAAESRRKEVVQILNRRNDPSSYPFEREGAQRVIDKNTQTMQDYYDYLQFDFEPSNILERRAAREAVYTGRVPFGLEETKYLYGGGGSATLGTSLNPSDAEELGVPKQITVAGASIRDPRVSVHEGLHNAIETLPGFMGDLEEQTVRALDYFRMKRLGYDEDLARKHLERVRLRVDNPRQLGYTRKRALEGAMSLVDEQFENLSDRDRVELQASFDAYKQAPGIISRVLSRVMGEEPEPEFEEMAFTVDDLGEMSEDDFDLLLQAAPAFNFESRARRLKMTGPRTVDRDGAAVKAYAMGGAVSSDQQGIGPIFFKKIRGPRA